MEFFVNGAKITIDSSAEIEGISHQSENTTVSRKDFDRVIDELKRSYEKTIEALKKSESNAIKEASIRVSNESARIKLNHDEWLKTIKRKEEYFKQDKEKYTVLRALIKNYIKKYWIKDVDGTEVNMNVFDFLYKTNLQSIIKELKLEKNQSH